MGLLILERDGILQVDCGKCILKVDYGLLVCRLVEKLIVGRGRILEFD